jgi:hypothetical protein
MTSKGNVGAAFSCHNNYADSMLEDPDLWEKWITKLKAKGFFEGVSEGSAAYQERYAKAVTKFAERMEVYHFSSTACFILTSVLQQAKASSPAAAPAAAASNSNAEAEATEKKTKGPPLSHYRSLPCERSFPACRQ